MSNDTNVENVVDLDLDDDDNSVQIISHLTPGALSDGAEVMVLSPPQATSTPYRTPPSGPPPAVPGRPMKPSPIAVADQSTQTATKENEEGEKKKRNEEDEKEERVEKAKKKIEFANVQATTATATGTAQASSSATANSAGGNAQPQTAAQKSAAAAQKSSTAAATAAVQQQPRVTASPRRPRCRRTMSQRSGLLFSVRRILNQLKKTHLSRRISVLSSVYLAAVVEYMVAEVTELSGNAAYGDGKKRITPRHIMLAVNYDEELCALFRNASVIIPGGGIVPYIHPALMKNTKNNNNNNNNSKNATGENVV